MRLNRVDFLHLIKWIHRSDRLSLASSTYMLLKKAVTKVSLSLVITPDCLKLKTTRQKIHETSVDIVKEKSLSLTFVKRLRKTLLRTFAKDIKTIPIGEEDRAQIQIRQRQLGIYGQGAE